MDPIDYTSTFANLPSPEASFMTGLKNGAAFVDLKAQQQQQQTALAQQQQKQQVIKSLVANPNASADDYAKAAVLVPELHAQLKQAWDTKSTAQQQSTLNQAVQWSAAIQSGQPKIASDGMRAQADAIENTAGAPTPESKALRMKADQVDANPDGANFVLKSMIAAHPDGAKAIDGIVALGKEGRARDLAPAELRTANAKAGAEEADATTKNLGIVAQQAGALAKPGIKPAQAITMFKSLEARGIIPKGGAQGYIDGIPTDAKDLPDYLRQVQASGMKADDQMKFTTPTADASLTASTSRYATDSVARTAANRLEFDKEQAKDEPVAPAGTPGLQGQKYLESLDKPTADQVKALAEGRLGFPVGKALQSPYWQKMITAVAQYDPAFDAVNFNARAKTRNDFVAGKSAENIKAINTAVAHMGQLNEQMTALDNSSLPAWNAAKNWAAIHIGGSDRQGKLAAADATAEGVAGEMAKVFRSTGMSEHEISAWREKFSGSTTPSQQKGTMQSAMHMLRGRMEAIQDQYRNGMGTTAAPLQILTPEAQLIFNNLLGEKKAAPAARANGGVSTPAAPAIPAGWSVKEH